MKKFPKWLYHPEKDGFICPSEEFLNTLDDANEWEELPFTGDRAVVKKKKCHNCTQLKLDITNLNIEKEQLEADIVDLKQEVERLRIALKMAESKLPEATKKKG